MSAKSNKLKTLYIMDILKTDTDEHHLMTAKELCEKLKLCYGIQAERKSIYNDIEILREYGLNVVLKKGKSQGYYVVTG